VKEAHRALREGTRAEHERLDGLFEAFDLGDRDQYTRFLSAHAEALLPVEAALDGVADRVIADWAQRRRSAEVQADLAALGAISATPNRTAPAEAPFFLCARKKEEHRCDVVTVNGDEIDRDTLTPAIAGALYVIEGSRLGGRVLARQVGAGFPIAYLGSEQPRGRWPALLEAIDVALPDATATTLAVASARAVFARFEVAGLRWSANG